MDLCLWTRVAGRLFQPTLIFHSLLALNRTLIHKKEICNSDDLPN